MTFEPVRFGIVSTADINRLVIPPGHAAPEVELLAVGSRDQARADAYAAQWEIPRAHGSYEALLADPDVEAVYISLPNTLHHPWTLQALEAGKHVLCEKPYTRHPEQIAEAFDLADRNGLFLMEAFMWRHNPQTRKLVELLPRIGELRLVRAAFSYGLYDAGNIRLRTDVEGGALMDVGCYCVNGSRLLAGEPESVVARQWTGSSGTDWTFAGVLSFANGVLATIDCSTAMPDRDELEAVGSEGSLFVDDPWHCEAPVIELRTADGVERIEVERQDSYGLELVDLSRAIRTGEPPLLGREDALGQARTIAALFEAAETGAAVAL